MRSFRQFTLALASLGLAAVVVACGTAVGSGAVGSVGPAGAPAASPFADAVTPVPVATQKPAEAQAPAATSRPTGTTVALGRTGLGSVLVDAKGLTLYLWAHDKSSKSTCNSDCVEYWPPVLTSGSPVAAKGVNAGLLGTSRRSDGRTQVTYAGHPLYYFVQDTKPGETMGEGLTGFGGRWDPISATGSAVMTAAMSYQADSTDGPADAILASSGGTQPLEVQVISPRRGAIAGAAGTFSVDLSISSRGVSSNDQLDGYTTGFVDPNSPAFHPGPDAFAPGLVVLLSTTPAIDGTPLQGPNTNLAGVFQINDISFLNGQESTFNSWIVGSPGFFGQGVAATLTVFVVQGTAPAVVDGSEIPISNVVQQTFVISR